ncbi:ribosome maturation factor RimP [candidate division KSB1 bacterium]|nr:ribosome maturation factor RimP [candidate division KSB1 bacterium]RQW11400.1 MAG: ribosome maturation factor RimP [candidate division KSB1 bacterium]
MDLVEEIGKLIGPRLEDMGVELVELQFSRSKRPTIRLFVWQEGGISLDRCADISRQISDLLDRKDLISSSYILQVSSPGLDRPLKNRRDFARQIGQTVKVTAKDEEKTKTMQGCVKSVSDTAVTLTAEDEEFDVELDKIVTAKVLVDF